MIAPGPNHDPRPSPGVSAAGYGALAEHVAQVAAAELPLAAGLHAYSQEVPSPRMRSALRRLSHDLDAGTSLTEALDRQGRALPPYLRGLIAAGVQSGRFGEVVEQHLLCVRRTRDIRARVWLTLCYPFLLLLASVVLVYLLLVWPVPAFRTVFEDFGVSLPALTVWMLRASEGALWLLPRWPTVLGICALVAVALLSLMFLPGRAGRTRLFQKVPILGTASRYVGMSEFCSLLAILIDCRVPLPEALRLTAPALRDPNLSEGTRLLAAGVERGNEVQDEVYRLPHFPRALAAMFRWAEHPAALAQGLRAAGELFAVQARVQSGVVGVFLQPFLFIGLAAGAGLIVTSLFMPLITLLNELA